MPPNTRNDSSVLTQKSIPNLGLDEDQDRRSQLNHDLMPDTDQLQQFGVAGEHSFRDCTLGSGLEVRQQHSSKFSSLI